jgi:O-antigen ligase
VTANALTPPRLSAVEAASFKRGTLFYILCLSTITTGYYLYWWLWKLKAYFIGWIACLVIVVCLVFANQLSARRVVRDMLPVLVWYGYLLISALWSPSPSLTLSLGGAALINVVVFLVSYAWARSTSPWALSAFFEFQALLILPIVIFYLATIGKLYDESLGAVRTGFAATCLTSLPFLIWRVRNRPGLGKLAILLAGLAFILSGDSRSGLLILPVLVIGSLVFVQYPAERRGRSIGIALLVMVLMCIVAVSIPAFRNGVSESVARFAPSETSLSVTSSVLDEMRGPSTARIDIERRLQLFIALRSFLGHPILGGGYQSTYAIIREQFGWEVSAHGLPSTLLGETGLLGTALFIWMIGRFFKRIRVLKISGAAERAPGFYSTCKLTMLGMLLLGMFHQVDQSQALFVLLAWGYALPPA